MPNRNISKYVIVLFAIATFMMYPSCNNSKKRLDKQQQVLLQKSQEVREQIEREKITKKAEEEQLLQEGKERLKAEKNNELLQWLQGNWEWRGTIDGYRNSCRLGVSDDYAVLATPRGVLDQGKITIDHDDNTIHFGSTYINFDYDNGKLGDFANGMYYKKMQNNANSRTSHGSSRSSSDSYGSNSRLMAKFNKLNEEGRRLVGDIGQYYNTGQAGPWMIPEIYRLKQIQDEKISLAQQMGDEELEAISRQQKAQTLLALRQMGF